MVGFHSVARQSLWYPYRSGKTAQIYQTTWCCTKRNFVEKQRPGRQSVYTKQHKHTTCARPTTAKDYSIMRYDNSRFVCRRNAPEEPWSRNNVLLRSPPTRHRKRFREECPIRLRERWRRNENKCTFIDNKTTKIKQNDEKLNVTVENKRSTGRITPFGSFLRHNWYL